MSRLLEAIQPVSPSTTDVRGPGCPLAIGRADASYLWRWRPLACPPTAGFSASAGAIDFGVGPSVLICRSAQVETVLRDTYRCVENSVNELGPARRHDYSVDTGVWTIMSKAIRGS